MIYMYGEKAAKELRDREVRKATQTMIEAYLARLDDDDAMSARAELTEIFAIEPRRKAERLENLRRIRRRSYDPMDAQRAALSGGGLFPGLSGIFGF